MSEDNKKAHILSATKNEEAKVICPYCHAKLDVPVEDLKGVNSYDCLTCEKEFDVDFDDFINHFIPLFKL